MGLGVVVTVAAVVALAWFNIFAVDFVLTWLAPGWPRLLTQTIAVVAGLALLRVDYVCGVWLIDQGRSRFPSCAASR